LPNTSATACESIARKPAISPLTACFIVHQFAHLFVRRGRTDLAHGAVSRRALPGFFVALEKMLGEAKLESYQDRARRIVARYAEQIEVDGNWAPVYGDPLTRTLILDALVTIAGHFRDFQKRRAWLVAIINGHLAPGHKMVGEGTEATSWELSERGCNELLFETFRHLAETLAEEKHRKALVERYGQTALHDALEVCQQTAREHAAAEAVSPPPAS